MLRINAGVLALGLLVSVLVIAGLVGELALANRKLGRARGERDAAVERERAAKEAVGAIQNWDEEEMQRLLRLFATTADAMIAEIDEFRGRSVPSPAEAFRLLCRGDDDWQTRFAYASGLSPGAAAAVVCGRRAINERMARHLADFTGVSVNAWLMLSRIHAAYRLLSETTMVRTRDALAAAISRRRDAFAELAELPGAPAPTDSAEPKAPPSQRPLRRPAPAPETQVVATPLDHPAPPAGERSRQWRPADDRQVAARAAALTELPVLSEPGEEEEPTSQFRPDRTLPGVGLS
ncbi:hypothetical protein BE17_30775 [Sorangium cellulosum]|uniref:Uncharacterized protein n=1 Tax=Sorangium cellulosum TaxID=56 RepID=A0A150RWF6_SORCE|nr:hypothetical protein BE17_30775 [Sorangium cellulosum]